MNDFFFTDIRNARRKTIDLIFKVFLIVSERLFEFSSSFFGVHR